mmetsp:Transcript_8310/g.23754  ORF Transcript_8310/g.23754 Transcript_8310/m.23754 type:complete len:305 (-) Transcript_8310:2801-3715(-)
MRLWSSCGFSRNSAPRPASLPSTFARAPIARTHRLARHTDASNSAPLLRSDAREYSSASACTGSAASDAPSFASGASSTIAASSVAALSAAPSVPPAAGAWAPLCAACSARATCLAVPPAVLAQDVAYLRHPERMRCANASSNVFGLAAGTRGTLRSLRDTRWARTKECAYQFVFGSTVTLPEDSDVLEQLLGRPEFSIRSTTPLCSTLVCTPSEFTCVLYSTGLPMSSGSVPPPTNLRSAIVWVARRRSSDHSVEDHACPPSLDSGKLRGQSWRKPSMVSWISGRQASVSCMSRSTVSVSVVR